jgi:hypothetical protein
MPPVLPREIKASAWPSLHQLGGAANGGIPLFAQGDHRLVRHLHHFRGVDHADAVVAKAAGGQRRMDFFLVTNKIDDG